MSKNLFGLGITALMLSVAPVSGQQLGTVEQARAMLDRAISALKSNEAAALSEFNDPNNKQFHERDLYVFCYNMCLMEPSRFQNKLSRRALAIKVAESYYK